MNQRVHQLVKAEMQEIRQRQQEQMEAIKADMQEARRRRREQMEALKHQQPSPIPGSEHTEARSTAQLQHPSIPDTVYDMPATPWYPTPANMEEDNMLQWLRQQPNLREQLQELSNQQNDSHAVQLMKQRIDQMIGEQLQDMLTRRLGDMDRNPRNRLLCGESFS